MIAKIEKILVFTSGGDSPGMNACIRAVVRTACYNGLKIMGSIKGYDGLINDNIINYVNVITISNVEPVKLNFNSLN